MLTTAVVSSAWSWPTPMTMGPPLPVEWLVAATSNDGLYAASALPPKASARAHADRSRTKRIDLVKRPPFSGVRRKLRESVADFFPASGRQILARDQRAARRRPNGTHWPFALYPKSFARAIGK